MSETLRTRARVIFLEVIENHPPDTWSEYVDAVCKGHPQLRDAVLALLEAHREQDSLFDHASARFGDSLTMIGRVLLPEVPGDDSPLATTPGRGSEAPPDRVGRYRIEGEIARGGVGIVYRARDDEIGRSLAVKLLLDDHRRNPEMLQRFVEEAQISGQLQHPGIAPVHDVGLFARDKPFFVMKLIKGQTLAKLLDGRRHADQDRQRFLGIFSHVCETVAYAHARGVIHRDLKPSNVMIGSFGEVQIVDWGLAKVLAQGGIADDARADSVDGSVMVEHSAIETVRSGSTSSKSLAGSVFGTPAYMSPEQARGRIDELDETADVFGLGAILCEILTARPPYLGTSQKEVLYQARKGCLVGAHSRLDVCGGDPEVIALAKRCLAFEPRERPRDATAVSAEVRNYLESLEERARTLEVRAARFRVKMTMALAAALLLAVGIAATALWFDQDRRRRAKATENVMSLVQEARSRRAAAEASDPADHEAWTLAKEAMDQAARFVNPDVAKETRRTLEREIREVDVALQKSLLRSKLEEFRDLPLDYGSTSLEKIDSRYSTAFKDFLGRDVESMDPPEAESLIRASGMSDEIGLGLREWTFVRYLLSLRRGGDWLERAKETIGTSISQLAQRVTPSRGSEQLGKLSLSSGAIDLEGPLFTDFLESASTAELVMLAKGIGMGKRSPKLPAALAALRVALAREPSNYRVIYDLSRVLRQSQRPAEALLYAMTAKSMHPDRPHPWWTLGDVLEELRDFDGALEAYVQARILDPGDPQFRWELRSLLEREDRPEFGDAAVQRLLASLSDILGRDGPASGVARELIDVLAYACIDSTLASSGLIIDEGDSWRYFAAGHRPFSGIAWAAPEFDDSTWPAGPSGFGYGDEDDATVLSEMQGRHRRVFIRRAFVVPDPLAVRRLELSIRVDDGCIVFINGEPLAFSRVTPEGDAWAAAEPLAEIRFEISHDRLRAGRNVIAIEGINSSLESSDFSLIPRLRAELTPKAALGARRDRLERIRMLFSPYSSPATLAYFDGRILQCAGQNEEATGKLRTAFLAHPASGSARAAYLSVLLESRAPAEAAEDLRELFAQASPAPVSFWDSYLRGTLTEKGWTVREALAPFRRHDGRRVGEGDGCHASRIFLERLQGGRGIRINCGGWHYNSASDGEWTRDRFFAGGAPYAFGTTSYKGEIHRTLDDTIYQWQRWFWASGSSTAYRVPLPRGRYRITLHFAEIHAGRYDWRFDLLLEGEKVLELYRVGEESGSATAEVRSFEVDVEDRELDIELLPRRGHQEIAGIEIQSVD